MKEIANDSEARFYRLLQNIPAIAIQGYRLDGTTTYWNQASERLYGYKAAEVLGRNLVELIIPPEMRTEVEESMKWMAETGQPIPSAELSLMKKNGSRISVFSNHALVQLPGSPPELFCLDIDLSERKQMEERIHRLEKMEALGRVAGGVAHDLNNLLGIVVGYSELVLNDLDGCHPLHKDLKTIMESGQRAAAIVQDLLTMAGKGMIDHEPVNLNQVVAECLDSPEHAKLFAAHRGVQVRIVTEPGQMTIFASAVHLEKVIGNLVSNAMEAISGSGLVTIQLEKRSLDGPVHGYEEIPAGKFAALSVSDTGGGISPEDMPHIFEPFYTTKRMSRSGSGLGLSVVWGVVKDHNGYVDVQTLPGQGTSFTLYFPVDEAGRT